MAVIARPFYWLGRLTAHLGTCGNAGLIVGAVTGAILTFAGWAHEDETLPSALELLGIYAMLAPLGWVLLLGLFIGLFRMEPASVAVPTLVNTLLVVGLTLILVHLLDAYEYGWLLGPIVGALVGLLLCYLSALFAKGAARGVHQ